MENSLVSILMPFKNTEDYLPECLQSILNQSYRNWQLIAVNDFSTDSSRIILEKYAAKDSRIRVFDNIDSGIIAALRLAYAKSNGLFITRMDSDDIMALNKLEVMVTALLKYGEKHLAIGQVQYFAEQGISNGYARYEKWLNQLTAIGNNYAEIYKECVVPSPCWMVYRVDLEACASFVPELYPEDYDLTFRFYEKQLKCIPCEQTLHYWRDYETRTSRTSEHYAQNYFLDIKLHYFLKLEYNTTRPLVIWGAGYKGKTIAKKLIDNQINFYWICDNPKKIGKDIYGKKMLHFSKLLELDRPQSIIIVANEEAQIEINTYFSEQKQKPMQDYFFFC